MRPELGLHFLITTEAEAATGAASIQLDGIDAFAVDGTHGTGPEQLAELQCVVTGRQRDYSVLGGYKIIFTHDEMHGPWLISLPDEFVRALAALDTEQLESIGERWLEASSGFRIRQTPEEWIQRLGVRLAQLARRAIQQGKGMYWEAPSC